MIHNATSVTEWPVFPDSAPAPSVDGWVPPSCSVSGQQTMGDSNKNHAFSSSSWEQTCEKHRHDPSLPEREPSELLGRERGVSRAVPVRSR